MIRTVLVFSVLFLSVQVFAQQASQTIRGKVVDEASGMPLTHVSVALQNTTTGTLSDDNGNFVLKDVPTGRYNIGISFVGYEPVVLKEILVTSGKEVFLNVSMKELTTSLDEVVISPRINKQQPLNSMATVSAKMLSMEEAKRYAGGFDDPARLVSAFAGVSGNGVGSNAIVVRGNSPQSLQWKLEGIEIPNPNHFADLAAFGGGGLTALSAQLLANSDFFTGAMPAEYGNALAGVFDIFMRNGNNQKREHAFQAGVIGIDAASEGPFKNGGQSSYLFNYRYSTLGLLEPVLPENAGGTNYQDLSFKLNFPTKKIGTFSLWGLGLTDRSGATAKDDINDWQYSEDRENSDVKQFMGAAGISNRIFLNDKQALKTTLAGTINGIASESERIDNNFNAAPESEIRNKTYNFVLSTFLNSKFSARHSNRTGFVVTNLNYDLLLKDSPPNVTSLQTLVDESGNSTLVNAYTQSSLNLGENTTLNIGINAQFFTLNNSYSVEPRLGFKYRLSNNQSLTLAYGLHSRLERLNYYFIKDPSGQNINKDLEFTKAHHLVLGYDVGLSEFTHLKIESYYQQLFNVPVIAGKSFSMINQLNDWFFDEALINGGKGRNYGLDLTFEKYLSKGYYFIGTASVFHSEYKGGTNEWRSTRYNRNFTVNLLGGKEWRVGKNKGNILGLNTRVTLQGGDRYSPVNISESVARQEPVFDEDNAFSRQFSPAFTNHFTASYTLNKKKTTQEFALKIVNTTMYKEFQGFLYSFRTQTVDAKKEVIFLPNLSYRIEF